MSKDYFKEIENMMSRIENIDNQIKDLKVEKKEKSNADNILKKYKHIKELNKTILDEFIEKVYIGEYDKVTKTRDIEIEWNFEF
jgi:archaellum component FlaC